MADGWGPRVDASRCDWRGTKQLAHGCYAEEKAGARVETHRALIGENRGTRDPRGDASHAEWREGRHSWNAGPTRKKTEEACDARVRLTRPGMASCATSARERGDSWERGAHAEVNRGNLRRARDIDSRWEGVVRDKRAGARGQLGPTSGTATGRATRGSSGRGGSAGFDSVDGSWRLNLILIAFLTQMSYFSTKQIKLN